MKASLPVTAGFGSPIIAADGTIYLLDVGYLYAIRGFAPTSPGPWPMKRHDTQGTARVASHSESALAPEKLHDQIPTETHDILMDAVVSD